MFTYNNFSLLFFASVFLSARITVDGSMNSCPTNATVTLLRDKKNLGCPCDFKTCISLCCHSGQVRVDGSCLDDSDTSDILPPIIDDDGIERKLPEQNYHLFTNDPCLIGWMASYVSKEFGVFKNGSISTPDFNDGSRSGFEEYCLMRSPNSSQYLAKVCRPWIRKNYYEICCLIIAILIMLAIFIGYTVAPELRNLHGLIFRSYVASYIMIYVFSLAVMFTTELRINDFWFSFAEMSARCFAGSCAFWLTVMSFNIWRSFRNLRPIVNCDFKERERRKFICYAIYAWFSPIVLVALFYALITYVPFFRRDTEGESLKQWGSVFVITIALVINIVLHTSAALYIRRQKRDTAYLADGVNRHYEAEEQWFNLYLKLFVIMGGHIVTWPIWLLWPSPEFTHFLASMEVAQSILIFLIFIWKDNVKRSIRRQLNLTISWVQNNYPYMK